jgi:hypothetical protein
MLQAFRISAAAAFTALLTGLVAMPTSVQAAPRRDATTAVGSGEGTGGGPGTGTGEGKARTTRRKRMQRWVMGFDTEDGKDYLKQLRALGAILAVPAPESARGKYGYLVFRDLKQLPAQGKVEDISKLNRIFWVDDGPKSTRRLAKALQLKDRPRFIAAFFPEKLEQKLREMERKYSGGLDEEEIQETRFKIVKKGETYQPEVEHLKKQKPKKAKILIGPEDPEANRIPDDPDANLDKLMEHLLEAKNKAKKSKKP